MAQQRDFQGDRSSEAGHSGIDALYLIVLRTEAKIDTMLQTQSLRDEAVNSEFRNLRNWFTQQVEIIQARDTDHEQRMRALEARRYVDPRTVWAAMGILTSLGMFIIAIFNVLTR